MVEVVQKKKSGKRVGVMKSWRTKRVMRHEEGTTKASHHSQQAGAEFAADRLSAVNVVIFHCLYKSVMLHLPPPPPSSS